MLAMVSIHHNNSTNYRGCIDISNVVEKKGKHQDLLQTYITLELATVDGCEIRITS